MTIAHISKLKKIQDITTLSNGEIENMYKEYVNPFFVNLLKLLGLNKVFVTAEGNKVIDSEGKEYLDFLGAYGALNIGHNNKKIIDKISQLQKAPNLLQTAINPVTALLAENLSVITPGKLQYTFFCNSGAEAVEGAIKLAKIATGKSRIIYCNGSFHGKTMGALSVTGREKYKKYFGPLIPLSFGIPFGDIKALKDILNKHDDIAAFILEPIQGEGGIITPPRGYLKEVESLCNEMKILLIIDEIQTGFGRTGDWFACNDEDIKPDILCMAKSLGGGIMPIGAYITTQKVWNKGYGSMDRCLLHTSTFGGNTWACVAALATIEVIEEEKLCEEAKYKGNYFIKKLQQIKEKYPVLKEVRGRGLMIGLEFDDGISRMAGSIMGNHKDTVREYIGGMMASKLTNQFGIITAYTLNNPNVIRIEPPLTIAMDEIDYFLASLESVLKNYKGFAEIPLQTAKNLLNGLVAGRDR